MKKILAAELVENGYNMITLPSTGFEPLAVLFKNKKYLSGENVQLEDLFSIGDVAPPSTIIKKKVEDILATKTTTYGFSSGIELISGLLEKLKLGKLKSNIEASGDTKLIIGYNNIFSYSLDGLELDGFVSGSKPDEKKFHTYSKMAKNDELFVVTAVLKSNSYKVVISKNNETSVETEALLKGLGEANVKFNHSGANEIVLENDSVEPLSFAFKARQLLYDEDKLWGLIKGSGGFSTVVKEGTIYKSEENIKHVPLDMGLTPLDVS